MLRAIVFDFDGVLVDSEPVHFQALAEVGRTVGFEIDYDRYLETFVGFDDRDSFRVMLAKTGQAADGQRVAELCARKQQVFDRLVRCGVSTVLGAVELVNAAYGSLPLAIASGATSADIEQVLHPLGIGDKFEVVVSADDVRESKPNPQTYALAVQRLAAQHPELGLQPADCLSIEDTQFGIASAKTAGLMTLGLATTGPAERLFEAQRVVPGLADVTLALLHEWFD